MVSQAVADFHNENNSLLIITHHNLILQHLQPDAVHILMDGRVIRSGGADLLDAVEAYSLVFSGMGESMVDAKRPKTHVEDPDRGVYDIRDRLRMITKQRRD